jgi:hypothetical protein
LGGESLSHFNVSESCIYLGRSVLFNGRYTDITPLQLRRRKSNALVPARIRHRLTLLESRSTAALEGGLPPPPPSPSATQTLRLDHFIAYALHRTQLHPSVTFAALYLLQRLKARFPPCTYLPVRMSPSAGTAFYHPNSVARPFHRLRFAPHVASPVGDVRRPLPPPASQCGPRPPTVLPQPVPAPFVRQSTGNVTSNPALSTPAFAPCAPPRTPPLFSAPQPTPQGPHHCGLCHHTCCHRGWVLGARAAGRF